MLGVPSFGRFPRHFIVICLFSGQLACWLGRLSVECVWIVVSELLLFSRWHGRIGIWIKSLLRWPWPFALSMCIFHVAAVVEGIPFSTIFEGLPLFRLVCGYILRGHQDPLCRRSFGYVGALGFGSFKTSAGGRISREVCCAFAMAFRFELCMWCALRLIVSRKSPNQSLLTSRLTDRVRLAVLKFWPRCCR